MDYEKKYNYVLKHAKALKESSLSPQIKNWVDSVFPELKESEDERIRKTLLEMVDDITDDDLWIDYNVHKKDAISWLEKQGEQKEYTFKALPRLLDMIEPTERAKAYCQKLIDSLVKEGYFTDAKIVGECLKKMNGENVPMAIMDEKQSKSIWIDEDEELCQDVLDAFEALANDLNPSEDWEKLYDWLISLKQRIKK